MTTAERIRKRRKELGISAEELGAAIGKNRSTIFRYEKGYIEKLPLNVLRPIADALLTTPEYLMGWDESHSSNTINGNNNIIGNGNTVSNTLTEAEQALLDMYNQMDIIKKSKLIAYASELLKEP